MDCRSSHISREFSLSFKLGRSVHDGTVIPDDQISWIFPSNMQNVLRLSSMIDEFPDQFKSFFLVHSHDMASVGSNVHGLGTIGVDLHHIVNGSRFGFCFVITGGVSGCGEISRMPERVSALTASDLILLLFGEILVCGTDVGEMRISSPVVGKDVSQQERIRRSSGIKRRVDMPQRVTLISAQSYRDSVPCCIDIVFHVPGAVPPRHQDLTHQTIPKTLSSDS